MVVCAAVAAVEGVPAPEPEKHPAVVQKRATRRKLLRMTVVFIDSPFAVQEYYGCRFDSGSSDRSGAG